MTRALRLIPRHRVQPADGVSARSGHLRGRNRPQWTGLSAVLRPAVPPVGTGLVPLDSERRTGRPQWTGPPAALRPVPRHRDQPADGAPACPEPARGHGCPQWTGPSAVLRPAVPPVGTGLVPLESARRTRSPQWTGPAAVLRPA